MKLSTFIRSEYLPEARATLKPRTLAEYERIIRRELEPVFGARQLGAVAYQAIRKWHRGRAAEAPVQANRALAVLSAVLGLAARDGRIPANPALGVSRARERARERYLTERERGRLNAALEQLSAADAAFLRVLLYTGARPGELQAACWDHLEGEALALPDGKTGARLIHLPPPALRALKALPGREGPLFPGVRPTALWRRVRRLAGLQGVRLYDLRHTFASAALAAGVSLPAIGQLLGHRKAQTTLRYAHLMRETGQRAAADTAALLDVTCRTDRI